MDNTRVQHMDPYHDDDDGGGADDFPLQINSTSYQLEPKKRNHNLNLEFTIPTSQIININQPT